MGNVLQRKGALSVPRRMRNALLLVLSTVFGIVANLVTGFAADTLTNLRWLHQHSLLILVVTSVGAALLLKALDTAQQDDKGTAILDHDQEQSLRVRLLDSAAARCAAYDRDALSGSRIWVPLLEVSDASAQSILHSTAHGAARRP